MKMIFVSRHEPNADQIERARQAGVELIHVGDVDAFACADAVDGLHSTGRLARLAADADAHGVVCVHPVIAAEALAAGLSVGVFENINRAPVGEKPVFGCGRFVLVIPYGTPDLHFRCI